MIFLVLKILFFSIPCPARNRSRKTKIFGIGPNAVVRMFPSDQDGIGKGIFMEWEGSMNYVPFFLSCFVIHITILLHECNKSKNMLTDFCD